MDQREINRMEWENPLNWTGLGWLGVYSSKRDTRTWVPKRMPAMGWTLNFGHGRAFAWMGAIAAVIILAFVLLARI